MAAQKTGLSYWLGLVLLGITLIIGLLTYKDYGISWDEPTQRGIGIVTYNYITNNDQYLKTYDDRDLGTGFELPLVFIEKKLNITTSHDLYLMRHIVTHLFFLLGVFCGYVLVLKLFRNQLIACLGLIMLAFHPRIYAHSFFNTKDIPFLAAFLIVFLIAHTAFGKNKWWWYGLLGLACGYATSIRVMGILLLPCFLSFFVFDLIAGIKDKQKPTPLFAHPLVFVAGYCLMLYVSWPILWSAPVHYFVEQFQTQAHIFWKGEVLFMGKNVNGAQLPLNYLPVWFGITMPEVWLVAGLSGFGMLSWHFLKSPSRWLKNNADRNFLLYLACFIGPVVGVVAINAVNYDDWRHLYFIYPSFVLLALYGINKLLATRFIKVVWAGLGLQMILVGVFMAKAHPHHQVYFNNLVSHKNEYLRQNYDMDYWGCACKLGLQYILANDNADTIKVCKTTDPVINAIRWLKPEQQKRVKLCTPDENPTYYITSFRNHPGDYPYPITFYEIKVLNSTIMRVYKMR